MTVARWFMADEVILLPVGVHLKSTLGNMWPGHRIHSHLISMTTLQQPVFLSTDLSFTITAEILARSLAIASWIHSYFDNVMTKFLINNRTNA